MDNLWKKGCELLGTKYAILGGAMTWVSERNLVSAISNAGGFGDCLRFNDASDSGR